MLAHRDFLTLHFPAALAFLLLLTPFCCPTWLQGNFVKATFYALSASYGFLTPELWRETVFSKNPLQVRHVWRCPGIWAGLEQCWVAGAATLSHSCCGAHRLTSIHAVDAPSLVDSILVLTVPHMC